MPSIQDWHDLRVRAGTIVRAEVNDTSRLPALRLWIDLGDLGTVQSSAKITDLYHPDQLVGTQVVAVTGFEPLLVGGFRSDVLVLGALTADGVVLLRPDRPVDPGSEIA